MSDTYASCDLPQIVESPQRPVRLPLSAVTRWALAVWAGCILLGFLLVSLVTPSPLRYGTHQQMGFGPCLMRLWWSVPCPWCGMTTSLAHFVRGSWLRAWDVHPAGPLFGLGVLIQVPWCLISGWCGRIWGGSMAFVLLTTWLGLVLLVAGAVWVSRLPGLW